MSLLKKEPSGRVCSLQELFALAAALEQEAERHYTALAERMLALDQKDIAEVFRRLAAEEGGHAEHVRNWSRSATGIVADPAWLRWQPPETLDEAAARDLASSSLASAYRALSMAVHNEERAFALWTYIAAQADSPEIQAAAERMAQEELQHAALLRRERRRAFHKERPGGPGGSAQQPAAAAVVGGEQALGGLLSALAGRMAAEAGTLRRLAGESARMSEQAAAALDEVGRPSPAGSWDADAPAALPDALRQAERMVEAYLDAADAARDEAAVRSLQALAEHAIARLAMLRRMAAPG